MSTGPTVAGSVVAGTRVTVSSSPLTTVDALRVDRVDKRLGDVHEHGLVPGLMEAGAEDRSHRSGADDGDLHRDPPSRTGIRSYRSTDLENAATE